MLCLSLQQPYASLVLWRAYEDDPKKPLKPIENRDWPLPKSFKVPQRVLIQASLTWYPGARLEDLQLLMMPSQWARVQEELCVMFGVWQRDKSRPADIKQSKYFGHILGSVVITGQVTESDDPWFFGPFGFTCEYPELLPKPIPYKGYFKFFEVALPA
ncbi:MAG: hypothetical protein Q8O55_08700 [Dehalococcoidales bacterium]|nr:hypothetical protein [Dehalococcoidales bacterium]